MTEDAGLKTINIPAKLVSSIRKEFDLPESELEKFIVSTLEKVVVEKNSARNLGVFTEAQTKDIEEELSGLGYL